MNNGSLGRTGRLCGGYWLGLFLSALAVGACASPRSPLPPPLAVAPTPTPTPEVWIQIKKTQRVLELYDGDRLVKTYPVVLGKDPVWSKLYEGDNRTPEGEYHISKKYPHPYWSRFMLLDYPTAANWELYNWSLEHGVLPNHNQRTPGIGGAIGIHGSQDEALNRQGVNWTRGCVSLVNHDVDDLYDRVPLGTRVVIRR